MSSGFPVKSASKITSNNVSIVIHSYSNCHFILVSELEAGSAGTLVQFRKESIADLDAVVGRCGTGAGDSLEPEIVYDIHVLFGVEKPEILLAARVLGSKVHLSGATELPIIFGIGLKRFNKPLLEDTADTLIKLFQQL